jgi:hypothetical protein
MTDNTALINIGELSKPATILIEKISEAIGGIFKPWQIRRVAEAEGEAERIKAVTQIEISKLQRRALQRFIAEEAKKQNNIESITAKALPDIGENAQPQNIEDDWITNFFDKCKLISSEEMQALWSKVLSGEANSPGTYSKRTVNFLGSLDMSDAAMFQALCSFGWIIGKSTPLIFDVGADIYAKHGINFGSLKHLDEIGLLSFDSLGGYKLMGFQRIFPINYYGDPLIIEMGKEKDNELNIGHVILSKVGQELSSICGAKPIPEFYDFVLNEYKNKMGLKILFPPEMTEEKNSPTSTATDNE